MSKMSLSLSTLAQVIMRALNCRTMLPEEQKLVDDEYYQHRYLDQEQQLCAGIHELFQFNTKLTIETSERSIELRPQNAKQTKISLVFHQFEGGKSVPKMFVFDQNVTNCVQNKKMSAMGFEFPVPMDCLFEQRVLMIKIWYQQAGDLFIVQHKWRGQQTFQEQLVYFKGQIDKLQQRFASLPLVV